jgi:ATP-dependent Lon protease
VILPKDNEKDFDDIPERVKKGITPHFVEDFRQVYSLMFKD